MLGFLKSPDLTFEERAPHEAGFAATFREHIVPQLVQLEVQRWSAILASAVIFGLCGLAVWACFAGGWALGAKIAIGGAFSLPWIPAVMFWVQEERQLLSAICRHFPGLTCAVKTRVPETRLQPYRRRGLLPPPNDPAAFGLFSEFWERIDLEEELTGHHRGIGIWLGEGEITEKHGSKEAYLFDGTLVEFTLPLRSDVAYTMDTPGSTLTPTTKGLPPVSLATDGFRQNLEKLAEMLG